MAVPTYDVRIDWNNDGDFNDTGEDVTLRTLTRNNVTVQKGRDQARSLAPIAPGTAGLEVDNTSRDYSPENTSSPLVDNLGPGRRVRIQATHNAITYGIYSGYLDDYNVKPSRSLRSVQFSAVDALARLRQTTITTAFYLSISTDEAVHRILDAAGWPTADRVISAGSSTLRNWWEDGVDAFTALQNVIAAEGGPAVVYVDAINRVVFKGRTHRLTETTSTTSQATFRASGTEPTFTAEGFEYDFGWRDIINSVTFDVTEREVASALSEMYSDDTVRVFANGETKTIRVHSDTAWHNVQVPVAGTDFTVLSGSVSVSLSRNSGQTVDVIIMATATASIQGLRVYGFQVSTARTYQIAVEDTNSIQVYGRRSYSQPNPWITANDAAAVGDVLLSTRATRLPKVRLRLIGSNDTRLVQQLNRIFSDRITIIEPEVGISGDFFVEQVQHNVKDGGQILETSFGCEKTVTQPTNLFTFDVAGKGFNDGKFGVTGLDDPTTVFIFDHATQGKFDVGLFGN